MADVLVIVGSREAFTSGHVAGEWRSALKGGKRLVVALFESTRLPDELASQVAVADFRSSWRAGMDALARMLECKAAEGIHRALPPRRRKTWSVNVVLGAFAALIASNDRRAGVALNASGWHVDVRADLLLRHRRP